MIILARSESQLAFAEFVYSLAWAIILIQLIDLASTQCLTHFKARSDKELGEILGSLYFAKLTMLLTVVVALWILNTTVGIDVPYRSLFFLVPALYPAPVFEMRSKNVLLARIMFAEKGLLLTFCYLYLRVWSLDITIYIAYFAITFASLVYQFRVLELAWPHPKQIDRASIYQYLSLYWPIYLTLWSQTGYGHVSRIIIEAKLGMLIFAAVSIALQFVNALTILQTQIDRHIRPRIVGLVMSSDVTGLTSLTGRYLLAYILPLFFGCIALFLVSEELIELLFGEKWIDAATYLRYLIPLILTAAMLRYCDIVVVCLGLGRVNLVISVGAALILIASLSLMPRTNDVNTYLLTIVSVQAVHLAVIAYYLVSRRSTLVARQAHP